MKNYIQGEVTFIFVRSGVSSKNNKPYLLISNGRKEFYADVSKTNNIEIATDGKSYSEGDDIILEISILPGSDSVKVLSVLEN